MIRGKISRENAPTTHKKTAVRSVAVVSVRAFHREIVAAMMPLADAARAQKMSAYMRGQFEYLGIPAPLLRKTALIIVRNFKPKSPKELRTAAETLWQLREREYQYTAVDLLLHNYALLATKDLPWLLKLAQQKAWWDTVDSLVKIVSKIVRRERVKGQIAMDRAARAKSLWVRRIAMLHQLGWREETDTERLFAYADQLAAESEFFIRKAIGWALRDYAWHDPAAVRKYLESARGRLSPLTWREAGKHCLKAD